MPRPNPPRHATSRLGFDADNYRASERLARDRQRASLRAARPSYYGRRRALGFTAIGVGSASALFGLTMLLTGPALSILPHGDGPRRDPDSGDRLAAALPLALGLPVVAVGVWAVRSPVLEARNMQLSLFPAATTRETTLHVQLKF